jgi:membrane associated rhomboid family serine protease
MFPIGDENRGGGCLTVVVLVLVVLNALVFMYEAALPLEDLRDFIMTYGVIPEEVTGGEDLYTLITSMFVHGGYAHIVSNMVFLVIFGDNIERRIGIIPFVIFYILAGLAGSGAHILTNPDAALPSVGASGAISGVLGAYLVLYPTNRVLVLVGYWFVVPLPAFIFLGSWFLLQLANGVAALNVETAQSAGVAFWAHIGGFVAGMVVGAVARVTTEAPSEPTQAEFQRFGRY